MCTYKPCKKKEAMRPAFGVRDVGFQARCCSCKAVARNELAALDFTRSTHLVHSLGSARDRDRREWLHAEPEVFNAKVEAFLARLRTGTIFRNLGR